MTDTPHLLENSKSNMMALFDLAESIVNGDLDREYGEFIMNNPREGGPTICNGDQLLIAIENCYLMKEFAYHLIQSGRLS
jgi:hypothetical protein